MMDIYRFVIVGEPQCVVAKLPRLNTLQLNVQVPSSSKKSRITSFEYYLPSYHLLVSVSVTTPQKVIEHNNETNEPHNC